MILQVKFVDVPSLRMKYAKVVLHTVQDVKLGTEGVCGQIHTAWIGTCSLFKESNGCTKLQMRGNQVHHIKCSHGSLTWSGLSVRSWAFFTAS